MSLPRRLLAQTYYPIRFAKTIIRPLGLASPNSLRVLLYHDIAPSDRTNFATQLRWLARTWNFVSAEQFGAMVSGDIPIHGRNLLLTFDDGFSSNRKIAEEILNPMGIRALFLVVSDFVALEDRDEARHFIARYIQPGVRIEALPEHLYNMRWHDLEALIEKGHSVGGHTGRHVRLSQISAISELEREIVASADTLERRLGTRIEHFAYTFGDLASFSGSALAVARRRFRFIYSGLRGDNAGGVSPFGLRRDAIGPADSLGLLGAFLEGAADLHYARSRAMLGSWIMSEPSS